MKLTLEEAKRRMEANNGDLDLSGTPITSLPAGLTVGGWLDLHGTQIRELPDGLTVGGNFYLSGTQIKKLPAGLTVGGNLYLRGTPVTSLPEGLTVGGGLYLSGTQIRELPAGLTVGGWLDLRYTQIRELPDGLTVGGGLDLRGTPVTSLPEGLTVGGGLYLNNTQIRELPAGLTVGGWIELIGTQIRELPDGLTVVGWLDLSGTPVTSLPDGLTVGVGLDLSGTQIEDKDAAYRKVRRLHDGDYVPGKYLYADGILTHVKKSRAWNGYTLYVGKIPGKNVISDGKYYAHCKNWRDGIADLQFKQARDRGAEQYRSLTLDSVLPLAEAKTMYRIITGACRAGTEAFAESLGDKLKQQYTVREMIEVTEGQYGADRFREFWEAEIK